MKRSFIKITTVVFLFPLIHNIKLYSQISSKKYLSSNIQVNNSQFDSLKNFLGDDVYKYIRQEMFLKGTSKNLQKYGYSGFTRNVPSEKFQNGAIYKLDQNGNTNYDEIVGKYFTVLDVIKHPFSKDEPLLYGDVYFLKLQEKESKDTIYYKYNSRYDFDFPFVVVGYYSKLKKSQIGKSFIIRGNNWISDKIMIDMNSGNEVSDFIPGAKWKCVDVSIEEKFFTLSLILENNKKEQIPIDIDRINDYYWVFKSEDAEKFKKKFGNDLWNLILNGKMKIGMTKEMAKLSWGEPKKINETIMKNSKSEQWVYSSGNYLYFTNNILTAIQ